jgi:alpha-N-arabinofuranosidase
LYAYGINIQKDIGKEASTGHNLSSRRHRKPGYQYQMESVFQALQTGWSRGIIGSHVIRNNVIYDCGQNGIVGHMGCVFSHITGNHIYNIAVKYEFFGYEIAGIKLHAAIDVQICNITPTTVLWAHGWTGRLREPGSARTFIMPMTGIL